MKKKYIIAFDQGTTSTRALAFNLEGSVLGTAQKELTQYYPESGWVEHDPVEIFSHQVQVFEQLLNDFAIHPDEIISIGITNQRETTVVWDKNTGIPVYNAIVWLDKRTASICEQLKMDGYADYVHKNTGLFIDSYFSATKVKWILDHVDGARERADKGDLLFGTIDTWLIWNFTERAKHVTDHSNASRTLLYNILTLQWDQKLLEVFDIPTNMLPEVQHSSSDFGKMHWKNYNIPIYGVAGDQQASLFGQGGFETGIAKNTYGTGCFVLLNTGNTPCHSKNGLLTTLCCSLSGESVSYALEGSIFVGGASVQWLRDQLQIISKASETEEICLHTKSVDGLYVVPAFAGLGAPYWDMNARGAIYGLSLNSGKNEIIKATIDALAYQTRDVLDAMIEDSGKLMKELKVDGGASVNNYLMQFQADILNVWVDRPKLVEITAFGAAFLAGIQAGVWKKETIQKIRVTDQVFKPNITEHERHRSYSGWKQAVERTKSNAADSQNSKEEETVRFSILDRKKQLQKARKTTYDLIIIGGGVTGAGIALDAASRGLRTCLIEKNDFASGTSNKSTKLIHGGLRYLKQFEIGLVKESGSERAIVHHLAPHLVIPEKMLLPLIEGGTYGKLMTAIGLKVYDFLANVEGDDKRKMLTAEETIAKEPLLDEEKLIGGGYYAEYRTDDARLTIELLKKAVSYGATVINYCEMTSFNYAKDGKIKNIACQDYNTGKSFTLQSKNYVSAAGPWVDLLREKDHSLTKKHLHLTKGVHIVFGKEKLPLSQAIYFDVPDGRMIFAIPRGRATYVGTTDTNYTGNLNRVIATEEDAAYLLKAVNNMFPGIHLTQHDIESNWAGLRPLIHEEGKNPSELSRKDEIFISKTGLISIAGGKLTGYRKMAQRVIDTVLQTKNSAEQSLFSKSITKNIALTHDPFKNYREVKSYIKIITEKLKKLGVSNPHCGEYLVTTYGKQTESILQKTSYFLNESMEDKLIRAEVWYGVYYEMVNSLADFFVRRTGRLYFDIQSIYTYRSLVTEDLTKYLGWSETRLLQENTSLDILLKDASTFYKEEME